MYVHNQWHIRYILVVFCVNFVYYLRRLPANVCFFAQFLSLHFPCFFNVLSLLQLFFLIPCATKNEAFPQKRLIGLQGAFRPVYPKLLLSFPDGTGYGISRPGSITSARKKTITEVSGASPPDPWGTGRPVARQTGSCSRKSAGHSSGQPPGRRPPARKR